MKKSSLILMIILILSASAFAQKLINDPGGRYSFVAPKGWTSQKVEDAYRLANAETNGVILVVPHAFKDLDSLIEASEYESAGYRMSIQPRTLGNKIHARLIGNTNADSQVLDAFVRFSSSGGGVMALSYSDRANSLINFQTANAVAGSVRFFRPQASTETNSWQSFLSGRHLFSFYRNGDYFEMREFWLCASGTFYKKFETTASAGRDQGTWSVQGSTLYLRYQNGSTATLQLAEGQKAGAVLLGGTSYASEKVDGCR